MVIAGTDRREGLLLDRDDVGRFGRVPQRRCCGRSASFSCSRSADFTGIVVANPGADRMLQDTYYIVAQLPLRAVARRRVRHLCRLVLLVPEDDGLHLFGFAGQGSLLGVVHRRQHDLLSAALLGLAGMPRRVADYPDAFSYWNFVSSLGAYAFVAGMLVFFVNMVFAFVRKAPAGANPLGPRRHHARMVALLAATVPSIRLPCRGSPVRASGTGVFEGPRLSRAQVASRSRAATIKTTTASRPGGVPFEVAVARS